MKYSKVLVWSVLHHVLARKDKLNEQVQINQLEIIYSHWVRGCDTLYHDDYVEKQLNECKSLPFFHHDLINLNWQLC